MNYTFRHLSRGQLYGGHRERERQIWQAKSSRVGCACHPVDNRAAFAMTKGRLLLSTGRSVWCSPVPVGSRVFVFQDKTCHPPAASDRKSCPFGGLDTYPAKRRVLSLCCVHPRGSCDPSSDGSWQSDQQLHRAPFPIKSASSDTGIEVKIQSGKRDSIVFRFLEWEMTVR